MHSWDLRLKVCCTFGLSTEVDDKKKNIQQQPSRHVFLSHVSIKKNHATYLVIGVIFSLVKKN